MLRQQLTLSVAALINHPYIGDKQILLANIAHPSYTKRYTCHQYVDEHEEQMQQQYG